MFGREVAPARPNTLVSLKLEGIDVKSYGLIEPGTTGQEAIVDPGGDENQHRLLIAENGVAVGAVFVGPPGTGRVAADLIERRPDLTPILPELRCGNWDALEKAM